MKETAKHQEATRALAANGTYSPPACLLLAQSKRTVISTATTTHALRSLLVVALLLLGASSAAQGQPTTAYVIKNGDNYLQHNDNGTLNTTATTTFSPTTSLWTIGTSTIRPVGRDGSSVLNNYYLRPRSNNNTYSLNTNTSTNYNAWNGEVEDGGQAYYSTGGYWPTTYYLRLNGTTWQVNTTNSNRGTLRALSVERVSAGSTEPTVSGSDELLVSGKPYAYSHTEAAYRLAYTSYTSSYISGSPLYYNAEGDAATWAEVAPVEDYTYTWSLSPTTYASVNATSGEVTLNSRPATQQTVTLTLTATTTDTRVPAAQRSISVSKTLTIPVVTEINDVSDLTTMGSGRYILAADIDASSFDGDITFTGTFDGDYHTISGLTQPLFASVDGGTVKNLILDKVHIASGTNVGAVCGTATGNAKIYNCGVLNSDGTSSLAGTTVGGLVGNIAAGSNVRVVNCYNYATIGGTSYSAGIVGRNQGTVSGTTTVTVTGVRITNCMMYGDITSGTNRSPVYCGNHTDNVQKLTEYNYYRSRANLTYTAYNDQLAIDKDAFLTRFPFYRHILNTHREMAAYFLFGDQPTAEQVAEIGHWVLKPEVALYPIIEPWETGTHRTTQDIAANLPSTTADYAGKLIDSMGTNGYLTVNYTVGGTTGSVSLPITDMDTAQYDFTWGKVVLPFANELWTQTDYSKVVTGWKITSVTKDGTALTTFNIPAGEPYNFADRQNPQKDIYNATNNPYIFAQGGNYIVPYGVTAISIEANLANAFYLSDAYADFGYNDTYGGQTNLGWQMPNTYHGQTVYTNLNTLVGALSNSTNPHSQAIVLVGNYHYNQNTIDGVRLNTGKACTVMSVDEDKNQEPDYGWYSYHTTDRSDIPPIRFDFVPNIGMGMAERVTNSTPNPTIGIWHAKGWFELTETCVSLMNECEVASGDFSTTDNGHGNNRWIANSGYFLQIVRAYGKSCTKLSYLQIGGNAYVEQLYPGPHMNQNHGVTLRPVLVTGGEIEECFMTGKGTGGSATGADIHFWCAGGKIHKYLSAFMQNPNTAGVNVTAKVDHAVIGRFFGGGTSPKARITGNIDITMNNSLVDFYCGGPEFGDMAAGKTVTTHATNTTFGEYYGAGFGGTATTLRTMSDHTITFNKDYTYPEPFTYYTNNRLVYNSDYSGYGANYTYDYILYSGGKNGQGVARFYTGYVAFDLATTGNVTNVLNGCTVRGNYYGAGCQGKVNGTVTSTLTGCTLMGSVFGGGYKAASNEVQVYPTNQPTYSVYTKETGLFSDFGTVAPETFTWQYRATTGSNEAGKILYTTTDMSTLGTVTGHISLTIKDGTVAGSVFGGGNESPSQDNTEVILSGNAKVAGNVFGGGNKADVDGNTHVTIED